MTFGSPGEKGGGLFSWWCLHVDLVERLHRNEVEIL